MARGMCKHKPWSWSLQPTSFLLSLVHLIYVRYSLTSETAPDVDMTYLQFKWTEMFFMLDVNQDNILDTTDVDLSCEYFIRINNMTDEEVWQ